MEKKFWAFRLPKHSHGLPGPKYYPKQIPGTLPKKIQTEPKKKRIFAKHSREQKTQTDVEVQNIGGTPLPKMDYRSWAYEEEHFRHATKTYSTSSFSWRKIRHGGGWEGFSGESARGIVIVWL